jgi:ATP-binding cassette, subfamily C (CFTR/MRP), member 1
MGVILRGAMSSMIYAKTLTARSTQADLAPVTLMSTDVDMIINSFMFACDIWAKIIEVIAGIWLLWRKMGGISVAPVLIAGVCFMVQTKGSQYIGPLQKNWMEAVQRRVGIASTIVRSMKSIKLAGLVGSMSSLLDAERVREIEQAKRFRWLNVGLTVISK